MKKFLCVFFFITVWSFGQDTASVRCIVYDSGKEVVESAKVLLYKIGEPLPLDTFITNVNGTCSFPVLIDTNCYKLVVEKVGYLTNIKGTSFLADKQQYFLIKIGLTTKTCFGGLYNALSFEGGTAKFSLKDDPSWFINLLYEYPRLCLTAIYIQAKNEPKMLYENRVLSFKTFLKENNIELSRVKFRRQDLQEYNLCSGCFEAEVISMDGCD